MVLGQDGLDVTRIVFVVELIMGTRVHAVVVPVRGAVPAGLVHFNLAKTAFKKLQTSTKFKQM